MGFGIDVIGGALVDMLQKLRGGKEFAASFTTLQGMLTDDFVANR